MAFMPLGSFGNILRGSSSVSFNNLISGLATAQQFIIAGGTQGVIRSQDYNTTDAGWALFGDGTLKAFGTTHLGTVLFADGTVSLPSLSFLSDPNTGFWLSNPDAVSLALGGVLAVRFTAGSMLVVDGTLTDGDPIMHGQDSGGVAAPAFTFRSDGDTGLYRVSADTVGVSTGGALRQKWDNSRTTISSILNLGDANELTIASGSNTVTQSYHQVDTQNDDATDSLSTIQGGSKGDILILRSITTTRKTTILDTNNIVLTGAVDFLLDKSSDTIMLLFMENAWTEISRSSK